MIHIKTFFVLLLAVPFSFAAKTAQKTEIIAIDLAKAKSQVEFLAVGQPAAIKIRGRIKDEPAAQGSFVCDGKALSGEARIRLDGLDTDIEMRNQHMKEKYLETAKHPDALLKLKPILLPGNPNDEKRAYDGPFEAILSLHGVEKPVTGTASVKKEGEKFQGLFKFSLELSDYGIDIPKYLGVTVSKSVQIEAGFQQ